jgi:hypothetical protein
MLSLLARFDFSSYHIIVSLRPKGVNRKYILRKYILQMSLVYSDFARMGSGIAGL